MKRSMKLGVNIDHIATLRQVRLPASIASKPAPLDVYPDPLEAARICKKVGADSLVMHLREDRRHIQDHDVFRVRKNVDLKLNLEMSIAPSVVRVAEKLQPDQVTLVPEKREEKTTEGGLDLFQNPGRLEACVKKFNKGKIEVSLFIDPDSRQIKRAKELGVAAIELHTGDYANQRHVKGRKYQLARLQAAACVALENDLHVYAGHGLDYENVKAVTAIEPLEELNIGYSIVTRSLWVGFEQAVCEMLELLKK